MEVNTSDNPLEKPLEKHIEIDNAHLVNTIDQSQELDNTVTSPTNSTNSTSSNSSNNTSGESKMPLNVIDNIYRSMSKIIEALTSDNFILNQQVKKIRNELEFVCSTVATMKIENQDIISTYTHDIDGIMEQIQKIADQKNDNIIIEEISNMQEFLKKLCKEMDLLKSKNESTADLQKQILDIRTMLMQIVNTNTQTIRKEIADVKKIKDDVRQHVKTVVVEEVKEYMASLPTIDKKFEELAKEQRTVLSQHIRKSTVQRVGSLQIETSSLIDMIKQQIRDSDKTADLDQLKNQQIEFMHKIENLVTTMKEKIDKL